MKTFCLLCWIIGHNWKARIEIRQWINEKGNKEQMTTYKEVENCTRCGHPNPHTWPSE